MALIQTNVTEYVVEYLKDNISSRNWGVGDKIPSENQLTQLLGVSRSSVRTAIKQLVGVGALESVHGKGTFITTNDLSSLLNRSSGITEADCRDIKKVLEFRCVLEPEICYMAVDRITSEGLNNLTYHLTQMKQSVGNQEIFVRQDIQFHQEISKACDNQLLEKSLRNDPSSSTTMEPEKLNENVQLQRFKELVLFWC